MPLPAHTFDTPKNARFSYQCTISYHCPSIPLENPYRSPRGVRYNKTASSAL